MSAEARAGVVAEALSWRGTPFHHGARVKGAGVDCAQLLIAAFLAAGVAAPAFERYPPTWFLHHSRERLLEVIRAACVLAPRDGLLPGDIALFRFGRAVSHGAIVVEPDPLTVVHAFAGRGVLVEKATAGTMLGRRIIGAWRIREWV